MSTSKKTVYCICGQPNDPKRFMIQCDVCHDWFHGSCTGVKIYEISDINKYHCPNCQTTYGPSKYKVRTNWHRHDYSDVAADSKRVQAGTHVFIQDLKKRHFRSGYEVATTLLADELTLEYLSDSSFMNPILINDKDGLGLAVPPQDFTVGDIVDFLGGSFMMDVIDVLKQDTVKMSLADFADYYTSYNRTKVFNVVSLEFTGTKLEAYVRPPEIVERLSWVEHCWPKELGNVGDNIRPQVMRYCLIGTENSYTDFHIDFGGSSVWYHVLRGEKVFYLIRPTEDNLVKYERWMASKSHSEVFLGDEVDSCFRLLLQAGQTLFIPTGWIHAVLTTTDSIVFGGNFLHSFNIGLQLSVYEMELRLKCAKKFLFPSFETLNWFAASMVIEELARYDKPPLYLVNGAKALCSVLRRWTQGPQISISAIPATLNVPELIKDLSRHVKNAERKWGKRKTKKENLLENTPSQSIRLKLKNPGMFDFSSDDDEDRLVMEENFGGPAQPGKVGKVIRTQSKGGIKLRLSIGGASNEAQRTDFNVTGLTDSSDEDGPRQEQEAIQGMLSMSGTYEFGDESKVSRTSGNLERLKQRLQAKRGMEQSQIEEEEDEFERALRNAKGDDDFIYLGIDANDEDSKIFKKRGRAGRQRASDDNWNPKGVSLKGLNKGRRPQREGVKREIMENTLAESKSLSETATTPIVNEARPKRESTRKRTSTVAPAVKVKEEPSESKSRKTSKKGMATAKQRLGKILKIHKMMH